LKSILPRGASFGGGPKNITVIWPAVIAAISVTLLGVISCYKKPLLMSGFRVLFDHDAIGAF
jgi:hypothetical protein